MWRAFGRRMTPQPDFREKDAAVLRGERTAAANLVSGEGRQPGRKTYCSYLNIENVFFDIITVITGTFAEASTGIAPTLSSMWRPASLVHTCHQKLPGIATGLHQRALTRAIAPINFGCGLPVCEKSHSK